MIAVFVVLVSIGTLCDIYIIRNAERKRTPLILSVFMCFSIYSNGKKIIATKKIEGSIDCIHGIRFFSICWVVLGHTWYVLSKSPTDNMFDVFDVSKMQTEIYWVHNWVCKPRNTNFLSFHYFKIGILWASVDVSCLWLVSCRHIFLFKWISRCLFDVKTARQDEKKSGYHKDIIDDVPT